MTTPHTCEQNQVPLQSLPLPIKEMESRDVIVGSTYVHDANTRRNMGTNFSMISINSHE